MKPILRTVNGKSELWISGYIVQNEDKEFYGWWGLEAVCPNDIITALENLDGADLTVKIDGYGGSIWAGGTIYTEFMQYNGKIEFIITGLAASAHGTIAMASAKAGNILRMSPMAMLMMHNIQSSGSYGDYRDMEHEAKALKSANRTAINAFHIKSGLPEDEIARMMDEETWLNPQEALDLGIIDEIMYTDDLPMTEPPPAGVLNMVKSGYRNMLNSINIPDRSRLEEMREQIYPQKPDTTNLIEQAAAQLAIEKQRFGGMQK